MAQVDLTEQEAEEMLVAVKEMYRGLTNVKRREFVDHLNDIVSFLEDCRYTFPSKPT